MDSNTLLTFLKDWLVDAATQRADRPNCMLGYDPEHVTKEGIDANFDRVDLINEYTARYKNKDFNSKKPYSWLQHEITLIYGFQKAFTTRHKSRLQIYRDDSSQKAVHTLRAIQLTESKFNNLKAKS